VIAVLIAALAGAGAAEARVLPGTGMKGVTIGMTLKQVRDRLGAPDKMAFPRSEIMGRYRVYRYGLTRISMELASPGRVFSLDTTSPRERTASGVGVGSTEAQVLRGVSGAKCLVEFGYRHCYAGRWEPGRIVTDFPISQTGRVKRITVGRVID
jgi:hypothetical protein